MKPKKKNFLSLGAAATMLALSFGETPAAPLQVCATTPELGSLVKEVGGEEVAVIVFAKPTDDPHFVEPRPSFVKALSRADLYVQNGLDLETGWAPALLQNARNPQILPGAPGYVDASTAIEPLEVPKTAVDRSMGDVHAYGNPHYLLDPLNGLRVSELLFERLADLRPERRTDFEEHQQDFRSRLGEGLVGSELAGRYDFEKLVRLYEHGKLGEFLEKQGQRDLLGGWIAKLLPHYGAPAVADHGLWPYFARRFGLRMTGTLEPKPGIPPTTRHLKQLIERMKGAKVPVILSSAYYDPRHADFVAKNTDAAIARMANQAGARPGTSDYLAMIDYNVRELIARLGETR